MLAEHMRRLGWKNVPKDMVPNRKNVPKDTVPNRKDVPKVLVSA
jgi:hypothetical protein